MTPKLAHWAELFSSRRADSFKEQEILPDFLTSFAACWATNARPTDSLAIQSRAKTRRPLPLPERPTLIEALAQECKAMSFSKDFTWGFMFGVNVLGSMGHRPDFDQIVAQLKSLVSGEMSLMPTPEEAIKDIESQYKKPLPDELKADLREKLTNRSENDAKNREAASFLLREMGHQDD
jgi:hypothetical protein